jgi:phage/plasmid-like protein (TIGR03299 family)
MTIDVNAEFAAEKTRQLDAQRAVRDAAIQRETDKGAWIAREVAAGRMVAVGQDRYRVTQGRDAGEIFTVRRNIAGEIAEVVANHGLDVAADGTVALYSAVPAWHGLGQVIPGGTDNIDDVLKLGGIDFEVTKREVRYSFMAGDDERPSLRTAPGFHVVAREDTGEALGVVGSKYTPIQNRRIFEFLEELVAQGVVWESAGSLRGGRRVFVSMRVPENIVIDAGGIADEVTLFIAAMNSHDGSSRAETVVTPWRPVCANTERFAVRDARTRWGIRHTSRALDRLEEARRSLGLTLQYGEAWAAEETALARTSLGIDEFHRVIADLWPLEDDASVRTQGIADRRRDQLDAMFRGESERLGRTAYAAERSITDYLDHVAPRRPGRTMTEEIARAAAALEDADDELKSRAHRRLMRLVVGGVESR